MCLLPTVFSPTMKIGILGAGAIGCYIGGRLQLLGDHEVVFVGRQSLVDDIAAPCDGKSGNGMLLSSYQGEVQFMPADRLNITLSPDALLACDVIFVCTKSAQTEEAAEIISRCAGPKAVIVSFQNGTANPQVLRNSAKPTQQVLAGMVSFNVVWSKGAAFHMSIDGELFVEDLLGVSDPIVEALHQAGFCVEARSDMMEVLYGKLAVNMINAINALSGIPAVPMLNERNYRLAWAACVDEALEVYRKSGIKPVNSKAPVAALPYILRLPNWVFWSVAKQLASMDESLKLSMLQDMERGRPAEIDFINGEIVRLGQQCGVATPVNERIVALIKAAEAQGGGSPMLNSQMVLVQVYGALRGRLEPGPVDMEVVRQCAEKPGEREDRGAEVTNKYKFLPGPIGYVVTLADVFLGLYGISMKRLSAFSSVNTIVCAFIITVALLLDPPAHIKLLMWVAQYAFVIIGIHVVLPVVRQDPTYHNFCDTRTLCGVWSFMHVGTSVFQALCGIPGMIVLYHNQDEQLCAWLWAVQLVMFIITAIGQSIYHIYPGPSTLILDRFPECTVFTAAVAAIMREYVGSDTPGVDLVTMGLLMLGILSPLMSECFDDLRLFLIVTYYSLYAIIVIVVIFDPVYTHWPLVFMGIGWYTFGKLLYLCDREIYRMTCNTISGHSIMHCFNGMSSVSVALWLYVRQPLPSNPLYHA